MKTVVDTSRYRGEFFRVLQETERSQTAVMTLAPGADAGPAEIHRGDQILFVVEGEAVLRVAEEEYRAGPGACVIIPGGTRHHVRNAGPAPLFCLSVYAPPEY
ncbi:MAG: cupin domain-containing protein [Candidatus Rokubacteria bacterium]|nr:cupin domain-containing protein [Candidatus Rokubacteria bacterium]